MHRIGQILEPDRDVAIAGRRPRLRDGGVRPDRRRAGQQPRRFRKWCVPISRAPTASASTRASRNCSASGLFSSVKATRQGDSIVVQVSENNVINRVAFEGNSKVKSESLLPEMQPRARGPFNPATAQADVERIKDIYTRSGRAAATVTYRTVAAAERPHRRRLHDQRRRQDRRQAINFVGNQVYSTGKLPGMMQTTEMNFLSLLKNSDVYDPDRISADLELIRRFYLKNGYADFRVVGTDAQFDPAQGGYIVTITVEEGPQYRVANVDVESRSARRSRRDAACRSCACRSGRQSTTATPSRSRVELVTEGSRAPRLSPSRRFARAATATRPRRSVTINFVVDEGPRVYIERINVRGNTRTRDYVVRREFELGEGDAYNRVLIDRAERRLNNLGYFKKVRITNEPGSSPDRVVSTWTSKISPPATSRSRAVTRRRTASSPKSSVSEIELPGPRPVCPRRRDHRPAHQGSRVLLHRALLPRYAHRVGFDLFAKKNTVSRYSMYDTTTVGGTLRAGIPITDEITLAPRYSIYSTYLSIPNTIEISVQRLLVSRPRADAGRARSRCPPTRSTTARPTAKPRSRSRSSREPASPRCSAIRSPTTRSTIRSSRRAALRRCSARTSPASAATPASSARPARRAYYREIWDDIVGFARVQGGNMFGVGGYKLRVTDQFNLGPQLVRGFAPGGIGPRDISNPMNLAGQRARRHQLLRRVARSSVPDLRSAARTRPEGRRLRRCRYAVRLQGADQLHDPDGHHELRRRPRSNAAGCIPAYVAAPLYGPGSCLTVGGDSNIIRTSVGGSILWTSPIGPIRFDLAKALTKSKYDQTQVFRFSGGTSF